MKIERVESFLLDCGHFVRITADDGLSGIGQSGCWSYPEAVDAVIRAFTPYLVGQDPLRTEHHAQFLYRMGPFRGSVLSGAVSAVDIALWDLKGKHFEAQIWQLLGGKCRERVRLHLLMRAEGTPESVADAVARAARAGYSAVKFDPLPIGYQDMTLPALVEGTKRLVAAAREAAGSDVDLILELHRKLTPLQALPLIAELAVFRPLFFEDPIQIDSIQSQADIARRLALPIGSGERLHTVWEFRELLEAGGTQFVRPDVGLAGGLTGCKKIAAVAESYHAAVVTHNFLGPLLTAACVHLDASIPNFVVQEYTEDDEADLSSVFTRTLRREGGELEVPELPGLGLDLDDAKVGARGRAEPRTLPMLARKDGSVAYAV